MPDLTVQPGGRDELEEQACEDLVQFLCHDDPAAKARLLQADARLSRRGRLTEVQPSEQPNPGKHTAS